MTMSGGPYRGSNARTGAPGADADGTRAPGRISADELVAHTGIKRSKPCANREQKCRNEKSRLR